MRKIFALIFCVLILLGISGCTETDNEDTETTTLPRTTRDLSADIDRVGSAERFAPPPTAASKALERIARAIEEYENNRSDLIELNLLAENLNVDISPFGIVISDGLILFRDSEMHYLFGFMNRYGEVVIPATYEMASNFREGLAFVAEHDNYSFKWGFINTQGELVIPFYYTSVSNFSEGLAAVAIACEDYGQRWGFIDAYGDVVIPFIYDSAREFVDGYAIVGRLDRQDEVNLWKSGVIDTSGNIVVPIEYNHIRCIGNGLFVFSILDIDEDGRLNFFETGIIDSHNNITLPLAVSNSHIIDSEIIIFGEETSDGWRQGIKKMSGEILTPAIYFDILSDSISNYGVVFVQRTNHDSIRSGMYALMNIDGEMLTDAVFFNLRGGAFFETDSRFSEELAAVQMLDDENETKNVYINTLGEIVITLGADTWRHEPFNNGIAEIMVMICDETVGVRRGLIDRAGDFVLPTIYNSVVHLGDGLIAVQKERDGTWSIYEKLSLCP